MNFSKKAACYYCLQLRVTVDGLNYNLFIVLYTFCHAAKGVFNLSLFVKVCGHARLDILRLAIKNYIEAGKTRLKPIFMTAVTMVVGMLPTALAMTEGSETRESMAWVIIGGMVTSTVFTLIVIPIIFLWIQKHYPNRI